MTLSPSAHVDTFTRDNLPPADAWPVLEHPLPELQYPQRLNAAATLIDDGATVFGSARPALRTPDGTVWTYGDLRRHSDQVAQVLVEDRGVVPGNRVLLRAPNTPWAVACWLGVLKAGGVVVTTMVAWKAAELTAVLARTSPVLALVDGRFTDDLAAAAPHLPTEVIGGDADTLLTACAGKDGVFAAVATAADDVALLAPTSGTTGTPKITMHFHRDVLANADTFARHILQLTPDDVCAGTAPLAFTFGLGGLVVFPLRFGASALLTEKANPVQLAESILQFGITVLYTAPTGYRAIIREGKGAALARLRVAVSAGEHLPAETFHAVEEACGVRLVNGIGATEMLHVFISAAGDDIRPGATGRPVPGYRATVLDEDGAELPAGRIGRLAVIGPTGCRYLDDPRQADYVVNGWNVTGDSFLQDEDGYFHYQARSDDMIVASGYNIGAPEVETALNSHSDVLESGVIGRPDPEKGAVVVAFVVLRDGATDDDAMTAALLTHVRDRLAVYKCPREVVFVDALPRNPSGKLQHFRLRELAQAAPATASNPLATATAVSAEGQAS